MAYVRNCGICGKKVKKGRECFYQPDISNMDRIGCLCESCERTIIEVQN